MFIVTVEPSVMSVFSKAFRLFVSPTIPSREGEYEASLRLCSSTAFVSYCEVKHEVTEATGRETKEARDETTEFDAIDTVAIDTAGVGLLMAATERALSAAETCDFS